MSAFRDRWEALQEQIARAAGRSGRDPEEIHVVAATKTRTPLEVETALQSGIRAVGENRVQETEAKKSQVRVPGQWHLIGHLQTNKAAKAVDLFDLVQSVDSVKVAAALDRRAGQTGRHLDVLVQVNTSGALQSGVAPVDLLPMAGQLAAFSHLRLCGLMTIGAHSEEERVVRGCFARLRELSELLQAARIPGVEMQYLSMGMSGDFEWAIAEGSNMLRLGTVLFGPRSS